MTQPNQQPGWYPTDSGIVRWWDGYRWTEHTWTPPEARATNGSGLAVLAHLGILMFAVVVPAVVFFTVGQRDAFVRRHSAEAFNFQLTFLLIWVVAVSIQVATSFAGRHTAVFLLPLMLIALASAIAVSVVAAVRASRGRSWRYFVALPILKSGR